MKYVAFFRGINIGGKNKVKMSDLKQLFQDCGFQNVRTYIQSGNVLFESDKDKHFLSAIIFNAFTEKFNFQSHIILRSSNEISKIISAFPFTQEELKQANAKAPGIEHAYIYLSDDNIDPTVIVTLCFTCGSEDKLVTKRSELYLLCYNSIRDSKLATSLSKLYPSLTFRNQKTMLKINELLNPAELD